MKRRPLFHPTRQTATTRRQSVIDERGREQATEAGRLAGGGRRRRLRLGESLPQTPPVFLLFTLDASEPPCPADTPSTHASTPSRSPAAAANNNAPPQPPGQPPHRGTQFYIRGGPMPAAAAATADAARAAAARVRRGVAQKKGDGTLLKVNKNEKRGKKKTPKLCQKKKPTNPLSVSSPSWGAPLLRGGDEKWYRKNGIERMVSKETPTTSTTPLAFARRV